MYNDALATHDLDDGATVLGARLATGVEEALKVLCGAEALCAGGADHADGARGGAAGGMCAGGGAQGRGWGAWGYCWWRKGECPGTLGRWRRHGLEKGHRK